MPVNNVRQYAWNQQLQMADLVHMLMAEPNKYIRILLQISSYITCIDNKISLQ